MVDVHTAKLKDKSKILRLTYQQRYQHGNAVGSASGLPGTLPSSPLTKAAARTTTSAARRTNLGRDVKNGVLGVYPELCVASQIHDLNDCALAHLWVWARTVDLVPVVQLYSLYKGNNMVGGCRR